ncbi:MAG TPA: hypothetical protein VMF61_07200 [Candidatus Acidoferrales bacterium]|nr:hypothetical protein [Candidatus Acidoferrales bacterium]
MRGVDGIARQNGFQPRAYPTRCGRDGVNASQKLDCKNERSVRAREPPAKRAQCADGRGAQRGDKADSRGWHAAKRAQEAVEASARELLATFHSDEQECSTGRNRRCGAPIQRRVKLPSERRKGARAETGEMGGVKEECGGTDR